jgi:hypothetical protein
LDEEGHPTDTFVAALRGIALSPCGKKLFVSEVHDTFSPPADNSDDSDDSDSFIYLGHRILCVELDKNMQVTTIAGSSGEMGDSDGTGDAARFCNPCGLAMSPMGDKLFVVDEDNCKIRCISLEGNNMVTTIAETSRELHGCALAPDGSAYVTNNFQIQKITFKHNRAPIVIPPSTRDADFSRLVTDSNLPDGKVAFNVGFPGEPKKSTAAIGRNILSVRSPYFANMFTAGHFKTQDVVDVDDCDFATFQAMLDYLTKDTVDFSSDDAALAFEVLKLARKHGLSRLEALCTHHLDEGGTLLTPGSAVPLLEGARHHVAEDDGRMFDTCRRYMLEHGSEVVEAGGLDQLQEHAPVTKGLLGDAYAELKRLCGSGDGTSEGSRKRRREE